ncbi:hypothetical protein [Mycobacterium sp. 050134]|uniref:hypothetical protein n=1 Tax=Mycobacterium sp. 050134 TaxID=3096111 RepID=UPI002ED98B75
MKRSPSPPAARRIGAIAAALTIFPAPLLSAEAAASPFAPPAPPAPIAPPHTQAPPAPPAQTPQAPAHPAPVQAPAPANPAATQASPPKATTQAPTPQATTPAATAAPAPRTGDAPATTTVGKPSATGPATSTPPPSDTPPVTTTAAPAVGTVTAAPGGQSTGAAPGGQSTTGAAGGRQAVVNGSATASVAVAPSPQGIPAAHAAVEAAKVAPATAIDAANPPAMRGDADFSGQVQAAVRIDADHDAEAYRPRHWDYMDYDEYHRPSFYNPTTTDMSLRYFYDGDYRTVYVPAGGRIVLNIATPGVFPFTAVVGAYVTVGSFDGGAWLPPAGWVGPPPVDWAPWQPVTYTGVPVDFANAGQSVLVDRVTMVGHDDSLPAGQQDVFMLNDSTLARGEVAPGPAGGPPQVTLQQTQPLPGVGPWDNGQQYVNTALQKPPLPSGNHVPWVIGGLAAVLALLGAVAAWIWRHPRGEHALAGAPTELLRAQSPDDWIPTSGEDPIDIDARTTELRPVASAR